MEPAHHQGRALPKSLPLAGADPDFLWLRPILAINEVVFNGNMRLPATEHLGWEMVPAFLLLDIPEQLANERALGTEHVEPSPFS